MELWELIARERVRDAYAMYTHAGDRFRLDELIGCFATDGVLEIKGRSSATGRAEIRDLLSGGSAAPASPGFFVRHHVSSLVFTTIEPGRVESSAYFAVHTPAGLDHWGRYRDVLVPDGERWVFSHRQVTVDAMVPDGWYAAVNAPMDQVDQ